MRQRLSNGTYAEPEEDESRAILCWQMWPFSQTPIPGLVWVRVSLPEECLGWRGTSPVPTGKSWREGTFTFDSFCSLLSDGLVELRAPLSRTFSGRKLRTILQSEPSDSRLHRLSVEVGTKSKHCFVNKRDVAVGF